jgi:hypothetical protein
MNRQVSTFPAPSDPTSAILDTGNAAVERQRHGITNGRGEMTAFPTNGDDWHSLT